MTADEVQPGQSAEDPITAEDYATFFPELDDQGRPITEPDRTPWPPLQPGEKVRLELEVTVGHPGRDDLSFYLTDAGKTVSLYLPVDHPQVRVTRAEPVDGVPQVGELWADRDGRVHFVADFDEDGPLLIDADGMPKGWRGVHTGKHGPIRRLMTADEIARLR